MNSDQKLVIVNGKDRTDDVLSYKTVGSKVAIVFKNSPQVYTYNSSNVRFLSLNQIIDPRTVVFKAKGKIYPDLIAILDYGPFYRIERTGNKSQSFCHDDVQITQKSRDDKQSEELIAYFKETASAISLVAGNNYNILQMQYDRVECIDEQTVLANYLNRNKPIESILQHKPLIYPFGLNQSQKSAVENAFSSQISIIQGPPGTGKTQTILNIIANAIRDGKTVAVVSNNNSATSNVAEKLEKQGLSFLTAFLGSNENKDLFLEKQTGAYPDMSGWVLDAEKQQELTIAVKKLSEELSSRLDDKNRIAAIEQELLALKPEQFYFQEYYDKQQHSQIDTRALEHLSSEKLVSLWLEYETFAESGVKLGFFKRVWFSLQFGKAARVVFRHVPEDAIPLFQKIYYQTKIQELYAEKELLENKLQDYHFDEKMIELSSLSMQLFKAELACRYCWEAPRCRFEKRDFRGQADGFAKEYPVILSTTYSIKSTLSSEYIYDYLIVDEASQVDLVTGVLAFSCAKNIVIVGDQKQLPNVLTRKDIRIADAIWSRYDFNESYRFTTHNLLTSALEIWSEAPSVLLREHYRCHPKIAGFFNQKFYNGKLIVMTVDNGEDDVLAVYRTAAGNHARGHLNQRQIDVIQQEVLPALSRRGYQDIGIIAPYRDQAAAMKARLGGQYEVSTVHKFQGREKDAIILTSVDNVIGEFVDDPNMLNVAVSRAVKSLSVVISRDEANDKTNYGDLVRYIEYNNFQIIESQVFSVFDLLYKARYAQRQEYLKKKNRISEYDSENLAYSVIEKILDLPEFSQIGCAVQTSLATLVKDDSILTEAERKYTANPLTRLDFLLFHCMDKSPVLAIEIDGVRFHQDGSRQAERDKLKNSVLEKVAVPLLRIRTDESGEEGKITAALRGAI
ncbi:MAG: AAA domain-containing protein [Faecalibacterium sp.]